MSEALAVFCVLDKPLGRVRAELSAQLALVFFPAEQLRFVLARSRDELGEGRR